MQSDHAQSWQPDRYDRNARFVSDLAGGVVALLAPKPGEIILDLGCGDGVLTRQLVDVGAKVTGVDASPDMVAATRELGLNALVMDGQNLDVATLGEGAFDAVFSNAALHWMTKPDLVIASVARLLKPGGRFVGEMGGHGNVAAIATALIMALERRGLPGRAASPWYFPTPAAYSARLEAAGLVVDSAELVPRPTPLPTDLSGWLDTFAEGLFRAVPAAQQAEIRAEVIDALGVWLCDEEGQWTADYVRLRFAAHKPE